MDRDESRVYIIVLNYNGGNDTIECLESVLRLEYGNYEIVLIDNGSEDDSVAKFRLWAEGRWDISGNEQNPLRRLSFPPVSKPIRLIEYNRGEAEGTGSLPPRAARPERHITLIHSGGNRGFAGGNNIGLRYALRDRACGYLWLLNNDTVVEGSTLGALVARMKEKPQAGMCGSTLLYYHEPGRVQARGGSTFSKWLGVSRPIGVYEAVDRPGNAVAVEKKMRYVAGASLLVSRIFIEEVGLMAEDYFLYYEEIDWITRARGRYTLAYAPESIVYHREGGSIGSSFAVMRKSRMADFYTQRNRIRFMAKYFPWALPLVYLSFLIVIANRIRRRQWDRVTMMLKIIFHPGGVYRE